jgi:hypothetical protein
VLLASDADVSVDAGVSVDSGAIAMPRASFAVVDAG